MSQTTLLQYKTAVLSAGFDSVTQVDAVVDAINEARRSIAEERRWRWMQSMDTVAMTLAFDTPSESLSSVIDLLYVDAVRLEINTQYVPLSYLTPQDLRDKEHTDRTPDVPLYWTEAGGQIRVWPSPNQAYTVVVDYVHAGNDLADDDDADDFLPSSFKALVKWKAAELLCFRVRDYQGSATAEGKYTSELRRKIGQEAIAQRQTSQQVLTAPDRYY